MVLFRVCLAVFGVLVFFSSVLRFWISLALVHPVFSLIVVVCVLIYRVMPWLPGWIYGSCCLGFAVFTYVRTFFGMVVQDVEEDTVRMTPQQLKALEDECFVRGFTTAIVLCVAGTVAGFLIYKVVKLLSKVVIKAEVRTVSPVEVVIEAPAIEVAPVVSLPEIEAAPQLTEEKPEPKKDFVPERMVNGSVFTPGKLQPFMFWVDVFEDNAWYQKGLGFRVAEGCFTALHVVYGGDKLRFRNADFSKEVCFEQGKMIDGDAMVFPEECAPMGTTRAVLSRIPIMDFQQMVQITNGKQMSVGPLQDSQLFGTVYYRGSTVGGFSGAPYFSGKTVFGMHTGSESFNCGYEAAYLGALVKRYEDSDEYFLSKLRLGHRFRHRISPYDPEEVMIKTDKGYYTMDWKEYQRASELEDLDTTPDEYLDNAPMKTHYTKAEKKLMAKYNKANSGRESGKVLVSENCHGPAVGVSPSVGPTQNSLPAVPPKSLPTCQEIPSSSQKASQVTKDTDPPRLMPVPKSGVSPSTSESMQQELDELRAMAWKTITACTQLRKKLTPQSSTAPIKSKSTSAS